ncbi:MAG TPA: hypothetical protein DEB12_03335 [Porphyromonadaceae bacterium]|jgi:hypothetical protein|nr:hypothetical protein [Porphyromonadaceae bacterium]
MIDFIKPFQYASVTVNHQSKRTMKKIIIYLLLGIIPLQVISQSKRDDVVKTISNSAGTSMAYKFQHQEYTSPPTGYVPFYVNHVGRHGSRVHTSETLFPDLASIFKDADNDNLLTEKGKEVKQKIDEINGYMYKRYGDLSSIGAEEQKGIAKRMFNNYPEIFNDEKCVIDAKSTLVPRCILSMSYFCLEMKEMNPSISIDMESSDYNNYYLNFYSKEYRDYYEEGPWRDIRDSFTDKILSTDRFISSLFKSSVPARLGDKKNFMTNFWSAAIILEASGINISLYDVFTEDEIFALWQIQNLNQYLRKGPSGINNNIAITIAKPMLKNFIETSQAAIEKKDISANLRFAHAEGIIPFAALLGIKEASITEPDPQKVYEVWNDYKVAPMGANIQWIFYKNSEGEIIVKILHNEREVHIPVKTNMAPYYKWKDIVAYYIKLI